jgi:hypothetical protein
MRRVSRSNGAPKKRNAEREQAETVKKAERKEQAEHLSEMSAEFLDDIDRALKEALGFPDPDPDPVTDADFEERAGKLIRDYVQRGAGQGGQPRAATVDGSDRRLVALPHQPGGQPG